MRATRLPHDGAMSEQQWPLNPGAGSATDGFSNPDETYLVILEELRSAGEGREWRSEDRGVFSTRAEAQQAAESIARGYQARNPMMEQGRRVVRISPDEYLVYVIGLTADFHYRVSVGELLET